MTRRICNAAIGFAVGIFTTLDPARNGYAATHNAKVILAMSPRLAKELGEGAEAILPADQETTFTAPKLKWQ